MLVKIIEDKDAELNQLYENGAILNRMSMKTKTFKIDEVNSGRTQQRDILDCLSQEKFHQTLIKCKNQDSKNDGETQNSVQQTPKPKEDTKIITEEKKTVAVVKETFKKQTFVQKKRPISQVTLSPKKKLTKEMYDKMMKKF